MRYRPALIVLVIAVWILTIGGFILYLRHADILEEPEVIGSKMAIAKGINIDNNGCDNTACREYSTFDPDCCATDDAAGCSPGYEFSFR